MPKPKKDIILKTDKSFDELIEDAFSDKSFKKRSSKGTKPLVLTVLVKPKKKKIKKVSKKVKSKK